MIALTQAGDDGVGKVIKLVVALLVLFCLGWFGIRYAKWSNTNFVVTTDRVIHRVGVISEARHRDPARADQHRVLQSVGLRAPPRGRRSGHRVRGERGAETFEDVRKPAIVQNEIYRQMEANSTRMYGGRQQAATQQAGLSIPEQIEKLDELRKRGVISEQEFAAKKADLLNRM